jgi:potassium channel subfamily K
MATRPQNSEEQPIRELPEIPDPRLDGGTLVSHAETLSANKHRNSKTFADSTSIWKAEKDGEGYFVPAHIWFASVVFPLFAGAFGPMSSAFGICALAEPWRVDSLSHADVENPKWLAIFPMVLLKSQYHIFIQYG